MGGNAYLIYTNLQTSTRPRSISNVQFGYNFGYAHSFVLNPHWTLSTMLLFGMNLGNDFNDWKKHRVTFYPTASGRFAVSYRASDWGISLLALVHNKTLYEYPNDYPLNITPINIQLAYTKQFDLSFKKKR